MAFGVYPVAEMKSRAGKAINECGASGGSLATTPVAAADLRRAVARRVERIDGVAERAWRDVGVGEVQRGAVDRGDQHGDIGVGAQHALAVDAVTGHADVVGRRIPSDHDVAPVDVGRRRCRQPGRDARGRGVGHRGHVGRRRSRLRRAVAGSVDRVDGVDVGADGQTALGVRRGGGRWRSGRRCGRRHSWRRRRRRSRQTTSTWRRRRRTGRPGRSARSGQ